MLKIICKSLIELGTNLFYEGECVGLVVEHQTQKGRHLLGPKEIDGLLLPPGKASKLLTDHLITD